MNTRTSVKISSIDYTRISVEMKRAWDQYLGYVRAVQNDDKPLPFLSFMAGWNVASSVQWIDSANFSQIPENTWCWCLLKPLSIDESESYVIPAYRSSQSAGGWTNGDTWEDFDRQVIAACVIPLPRKP